MSEKEEKGDIWVIRGGIGHGIYTQWGDAVDNGFVLFWFGKKQINFIPLDAYHIKVNFSDVFKQTN